MQWSWYKLANVVVVDVVVVVVASLAEDRV